MHFMRLTVAATVLVGVGLTVPGKARGQSRTDARRNPPTATQPGANRLGPEASKIYRYVHMMKPGDLDWQQIPWLVDLEDGVRLAKAENRPILIWATDDDPIDRC